jgi:hypothetical protein
MEAPMFSKVNAIVLELNHSLACGGDRLGRFDIATVLLGRGLGVLKL